MRIERKYPLVDDHWVDIKKSVIYGSETAVNGIHFDTALYFVVS